MPIEVDAERCADFALGNYGMAEQAADDFTAQTIFSGKMITAHGGDTAFMHRLFPCGKLPEILCVGIMKSTDRSDAHAVKIRARFCGVSLEIAMQGSLRLRHRKFVAGFREVVHADV